MKTIIAGGRDYEPTTQDCYIVAMLVTENNITEIVSGCAKGADYFGEEIANNLKIPVRRFPADWEHLGKSAGYIRNKQMAEYADSAILFKGGKGTALMRSEMKKLGKPILFDQGVI